MAPQTHEEKILRNTSAEERAQFKKTSRYIDMTLRNSLIFNSNEPTRLPKFHTEDIEVGRELGRGEFSIVCEITHISSPEFITDQTMFTTESLNNKDEVSNLVPQFGETELNDIEKEGEEKKGSSEHGNEPSDFHDEISFMSRECIRHGVCRYAIKRIKPSLKAEKRLDSMIDLALESKYLAILSHPNIIHMRGLGILPCHSSFFIILDRLYETLGEKILRWKEVANSNTGFLAKRKKSVKAEKKQLWSDRILAAYDISRALRYLHGRRIMYRDLKPENVGFDVRGDAKIFDFGLAKELNERDRTENGLYKMSGLTGSRRYMAPEVVLCLPYNEKADVFSFGILFWEICSLEVPFNGYDAEKHSRRVVRQNERPKINSSWPVSIQDVIAESWSPNTKKRPPFQRICTILGHELSNIKDDTNIMDRSTKMLDSSVSSRRESVLRYETSPLE